MYLNSSASPVFLFTFGLLICDPTFISIFTSFLYLFHLPSFLLVLSLPILSHISFFMLFLLFFIFFNSTRLSHSPSHILSHQHTSSFSLSVSFIQSDSYLLSFYYTSSFSLPAFSTPSHSLVLPLTFFFQNSSLPINGPTGEKGRELNQITRGRRFEFLVGDKRWLSRDDILGWTEGFVVILTSEVMKV